MQSKPLVLALGGGSEFRGDRDDYHHLKSIANVMWIHDSQGSWPTTLAKFVRDNGHPLSLLIYGARGIEKVDETLLAPLVPHLRHVANQGAGYDNVDVAYCTSRGIWVSNTPDSVTDATANCAVWLILSSLRDFCVADRSAKAGDYRGDISMRSLRDPKGLKLGVVGLGRIGGSVAKKMSVFGMQTYYHSRHRAGKKEEELAGGARYVEDLHALLGMCDVISVHVPLSTSTKHLFDAKAFKAMKEHSIFINTARGSIHDEAALVEALQSGHLARAGLDVFENEPEISKEFCRGGKLVDRVVTTPHIGAFTIQTHDAIQTELLANVIAVLENDRPQNPVNDPDAE